MIVNEDGFTDHNLRKAGYESNPLEDGTLDDYQVFRVPMTSMTVRATEGIDGHQAGATPRAPRTSSRSASSPGCTGARPSRRSPGWIEQKFADKPAIRDANLAAFRAGYNFGETAELARRALRGRAGAGSTPGTYRNVNGTQALALRA